MENYDFVVEHRAGKSHGNADAISRIPPNEPDGIKIEREDRDNDLNGVNDVRAVGVDSETPDVVENEDSIASLMASVTTEQKCDSEICVLVDALLNKSAKPTWDEVTTWSATSKALWGQWERLIVVNGVLFRKYWINDLRTWRKQIIIPATLVDDVIRKIHTGIGVSHLGRK